MTLPIEHAREVVESMRSNALRNFIAQAKAKQVLREVNELPKNFPRFTEGLNERVTFIAYQLLAAGCSLIEQGETVDGYRELQSAADIIESAHRTEAENDLSSSFHCLIGAMAFYACGQYSRAFVLIKVAETVTPAASVIASYLRKDPSQLVSRLNAILLLPESSFEDQQETNDSILTILLARAISLLLEHSHSGNARLIDNADSILHDAMIISEGGSHPAFWWLSRLLRLMLNDYRKCSLWNVLPPFFSSDGGVRLDSYVQLLSFSKPPVTELWQSQLSSLNLALDRENLGGVINLRTGAGKTRVAELAILQALIADPTAKVIYLAPFRSLAFELERTFNNFLSKLGISISHLYGGSRFSGVDLEMVNEAHIIIATPEKAKAMLRALPEIFGNIKLVIVDEGHLLGGSVRDVRNELFLEHLRLLARKIGARMLLLSAVLPNADDLARWVGGNSSAVAQSNWKPSAERFGLLRWSTAGVRIEWKGEEPCFNPHFIEFKKVIEPGKKKARKFPRSKTEAVAATAARLSELGPVLIFAGQAQWIASMARSVMLAFGADAPSHPWPDTEWNIFEAVCREELGDASLELQAARVGVICHSNKLPPQVRIALEKLMAKQPARIIVATTTLGQGVNIGISSVIVATPWIGAQRKISKRDFWNICGRAGRAFVDSEGKVLFAIDNTRKDWQVHNDEAIAEDYFDITDLHKVKSGLLLVVDIMKKIAIESEVSFEMLLELVANNNFDQFGEKKETFKAILDLIDDQLLALHVSYNDIDDLTDSVEWVDEAFRESLGLIQELNEIDDGAEPDLIKFLKARTTGVLNNVPTAGARRAVVASGLPLSVAVTAFNQLDLFREMADRYLITDINENPILNLVKEVEAWARDNATTITKDMPDHELLNIIRPQWLMGTSLREIVEICGEEVIKICTDLYGYQLSWLFHSIAQKLDKETEENRVEVFSLAGLLVELGLPTESAAKVFLAGVRSRTAAIELSNFVTNPSISVSRIRRALLDELIVNKLADKISPSTLQWLHMLSAEQDMTDIIPIQCASFDLDVPEEIETLHVRREKTQDSVFLCSIDGKFKYSVDSTDQMPFDQLADDLRYVFLRDGNVWHQQCRDPRVQI